MVRLLFLFRTSGCNERHCTEHSVGRIIVPSCSSCSDFCLLPCLCALAPEPQVRRRKCCHAVVLVCGLPADACNEEACSADMQERASVNNVKMHDAHKFV